MVKTQSVIAHHLSKGTFAFSIFEWGPICLSCSSFWVGSKCETWVFVINYCKYICNVKWLTNLTYLSGLPCWFEFGSCYSSPLHSRGNWVYTCLSMELAIGTLIVTSPIPMLLVGVVSPFQSANMYVYVYTHTSQMC